MHVTSGSAVLAVFLSLSAIPASADPIRFNIEGTVTRTLVNVPAADVLFAQTGIKTGDLITGFYTFDPQTPGVNGHYHITGPFDLSLDGYTLAARAYDIDVRPNCNNLACPQ